MDDAVDLSPRRARPIARRTVLAGGVAGLAGLVVGCAGDGMGVLPPDLVSVKALTAQKPFVIGTRGGSWDWPEMTEYGFDQAAAIPGIQAMELVVARTADDVLVCSADPSTERVTGRDLVVANETWATLAALRVHARGTQDPSQPEQPFARFDDIVDKFIDRFVFFVEPVSQETVTNLMPKLISLHAPHRIVWKQPINSSRFGEAKLHGFTTWGYSLSDDLHRGANLRRLAASDEIDMLGASITKKKVGVEVLEAAERYDKLPVVWNVRTGPDLERAVKLGYAGVSTTAVREIVALTR